MSKVKTQKSKVPKGVSLIEILIVIAIFAILGVLVTRAVLLTLRGARKSESVVRVRENLDYALAVIERQLRNAESVDCTTSTVSLLNYKDRNGFATSFSCVTVGPSGYIASGSARLTSTDIAVTSCSFICAAASGDVLPSVIISVVGADARAIGIEGSQVTSSTKIFLRTY